MYRQLIEAIKTMEKSLEPATSTQIVRSLAKLRLHFPTTQMSKAEEKLLMKDYLADMTQYPADIIEQACAEYRRDVESDYFPKVGKLLSRMNKHWFMRRWQLEKLKKLLSVSLNKGDSDGKSK